MKKKILAILIALALLGVGLFQVIPALADGPGPLDHAQILPLATNFGPGATQQFTAQGYDADNTALPNLNYFWMVAAGGGTINTTGLFTAGSTPGTYSNTVEVIVAQGALVKVVNASVTITGAPGPLDHIRVTPANKDLAPAGTAQFSAQGFDAANVAIPGLIFNWSVVNGGGTISATGLFTAGATLGTFTGTVQAASALDPTKKAVASVTVRANPEQEKSFQVDVKKFTSLFNGLGKIGFDNFLGGQWQIKDGSAVDTLKAIPGVVQAISASSLSVLPNGQTTAAVFVLGTNANILPKGTQLAVNDKVVVVTVNDQVTLVVKITTTATTAASTSGALPPGLKKQDGEKRYGKNAPSGWSKGQKTGWDKD